MRTILIRLISLLCLGRRWDTGVVLEIEELKGTQIREGWAHSTERGVRLDRTTLSEAVSQGPDHNRRGRSTGRFELRHGRSMNLSGSKSALGCTLPVKTGRDANGGRSNVESDGVVRNLVGIYQVKCK